MIEICLPSVTVSGIVMTITQSVVYACVGPFVRVEGRCMKGVTVSQRSITRYMDLFLCHIRTVVRYSTQMNVLKLEYFNVKQCYLHHIAGQ